MNVKALKELINDLPDDLEIRLRQDDDGNGIDILYLDDYDIYFERPCKE